MELGKLGVFLFTDRLTATEVAEFAQRIESLGYAALWIPEALGRESFSHASFLLARTERLVVATGIANIYARDAVAATRSRSTRSTWTTSSRPTRRPRPSSPPSARAC